MILEYATILFLTLIGAYASFLRSALVSERRRNGSADLRVHEWVQVIEDCPAKGRVVSVVAYWKNCETVLVDFDNVHYVIPRKSLRRLGFPIVDNPPDPHARHFERATDALLTAEEIDKLHTPMAPGIRIAFRAIEKILNEGKPE